MAKLSERDVCTKRITPALVAAGWDVQTQIREEVSFTKGRIIVRGRLVTRGKAKRADYILYYRHLAIALIEAKDESHPVGAGMQQALDYAATLDIPYVFASNGSGFQFHDRTGRFRSHRGFPESADPFRESSSDFFDLIVIDECYRQGISDCFLAPYKVIKVQLDVDVQGYRHAASASL